MDPSTSVDGTRRRDLPGAAFLFPPLLLAATLTGGVLVLRGPDQIFGWALAIVFGIVVLWILTSALFPASADRTCPACGEQALQRLEPGSTRGLRCADCGWLDETASSFLLAEDDGVEIEPMVLGARRKPPATPLPRRQAVDHEA